MTRSTKGWTPAPLPPTRRPERRENGGQRWTVAAVAQRSAATLSAQVASPGDGSLHVSMCDMIRWSIRNSQTLLLWQCVLLILVSGCFKSVWRHIYIYHIGQVTTIPVQVGLIPISLDALCITLRNKPMVILSTRFSTYRHSPTV
jgi:hypothetical protein